MNHFVSLTRLFVPSAAAIAVCAMLLASSPAQAQETGTLRMTFKLKGAAKTFPPIAPNVDQAFCGLKQIPDETLVVNPKNSGIKNVIVYVYTGRRGTELPEMELKPETHELANKDCRFEPHVLIAKKGDTIKVTNPDKVGHNANFQFFNNTQQNLTVPAGGAVEIELKEDEPAPIPVACNIHNWMKAQVVVLDHPFAAVSNEDGVLEIKGLPVGEEVVFRANHENGSLKEVIVNGEETDWRSSKFEVEIKAGMNDMGTIEVPVDAFSL
ncbi:methylamine utilization protein [Stieleria mannarensis]|uniref:methylamine utilization protein n=1 Tax=Stieleria mannarensis TaxID=2755585 RepID=UPI00336A341E